MQSHTQGYQPLKKPDFAGYKSEEAKKKFTTRVIILVALFFLFDRGLPEAMKPFIGTNISAIRFANTFRGTFQDGNIWYIEESFEGNQPDDNVSYLKKLSVKGDNESEGIVKIKLENPWLLAGKEKIWIISKEGWQEYSEGSLSKIYGKDDFVEISKPFFYKGSPAVLDRRGGEVFLSSLEDGKWKRDNKVILVDETGKHASRMKKVQAFIYKGNLAVFQEQSDSLYYAICKKSGDDFRISGNWEKICAVGTNWTALVFKDKPAVVVAQFKESKLKDRGIKTGDTLSEIKQDIMTYFSGQDITGFIRNGDKWEKFTGFQDKIVASMGVFVDNQSGNLIVFSQLIPPSLHLVMVKDDKIIKDRVFQKTINLGSIGYLIVAFLIISASIPFIIAYVITKWMENYRITEFSCNVGNAPYASLWKRGIARFIDTLIYFLPMIAGQVYFVNIYKNPLNMLSFDFLFKFLFLFLAWLVWMLFVAVIMCYLEGKYGQTPGKKLLGIRVIGADDMKPCGFLRAVIRYFCVYVDGIFSYMVGITVIAFTFRWQRVGDLAAKTVVVDLNR